MPRYPSLFQINTRVWLERLSREAGKPITLADIDDTTIDGFAEQGFDWIWAAERVADRRRRSGCLARQPAVARGVRGASARPQARTQLITPMASIHNGLAQFQLLNYTFQGYVTPQGNLRMSSGYGHTIEGQINNQGVFNAQGLGECAYNATWRRSI